MLSVYKRLSLKSYARNQYTFGDEKSYDVIICAKTEWLLNPKIEWHVDRYPQDIVQPSEKLPE